MKRKIFVTWIICLFFGLFMTFSNSLVFAVADSAHIIVARADESDYRYVEATEGEMKEEEPFPEEWENTEEDEDVFKNFPFETDSNNEEYQEPEEELDEESSTNPNSRR